MHNLENVMLWIEYVSSFETQMIFLINFSLLKGNHILEDRLSEKN